MSRRKHHTDREHTVRETESDVVAESRQKVVRPRRYRVLLHNDDYTTMAFVVAILMGVFHHARAQATRIMLQVHHAGIGVAGVYSREVAETKIGRVTTLAREREFPLRCSMEPE